MGALVFIVALHLQLQTAYTVRWKLLEQWVHSLLYVGHHSHIPYLLVNMDAVCWGRLQQPGNQAMNTTDVGGAAGGSGCTTRLCTVKPVASICSGCQYRTASGKGGLGGYISTGAGMQQGHKESYRDMQQQHKEFVIMWCFSNLET